MLEALPFADLPPAWQDHDLKSFSPTKRLWDYQQEALQYALKALWKYYEDLRDYGEGEGLEADQARKEALWRWYQEGGLRENLDLRIDKADIRQLLQEYYPLEGDRLPYRHLINRMGFWMATGSGKSLVIVKLLEVLWNLIRRGEIPPHPVMLLTARDDLLAQLRAHVEEFNAGRTDFRIRLADLREYPREAQMLLSPAGEKEFTVYLYRSDNLSDEQKERILDFRNYKNRGRWYVLLDEAHKGDREDSKRQHIYSILSRNGFLFNFSATFTDPRDILTTVYNFNLSEFVRRGYGKHIAILREENRAFREGEDFTGEEKQRIVLKALLLLAYVRKVQESLPRDRKAYHRPLMLVLVNSVNTEDSDLELFFRELERIGRGDLSGEAWDRAREELWRELEEGLEWVFEGERFRADRVLFEGIGPGELLRLVYNAPAPGGIEVLLRPSNRQEMAFKLKSAAEPFALIKIGDISGWLKDKLEGYEVIEGYEDEGFFKSLSEEGSPINLLMGSRTFYEGWDSNRPNVITYINIGTGTDARKFILQSVGRGVRIEPLPGKRRRLLSLYNAKEVGSEEFEALRRQAEALETLFILGTNRKALETVIQELDQQKTREGEHELALEVDPEVKEEVLLVPVYKDAERPLLERRGLRKFEISEGELRTLDEYVKYLGDPRLLVARHGASPQEVALLLRCLENKAECFNTQSHRRYGRMELLLSRLFAYFRLSPKEAEGVKELEEEIRHFRRIKVFLQDITPLKERIQRVLEAPQRREEMRALYDQGKLPFEEMLKQAQNLREEASLTHNGHTLRIKRVTRHYYVPVLLSESERIDWINHVIRHPSEVRFLNALEEYLNRPQNLFGGLDWWAFSKVDETLDEVYVPYYDPLSNAIRRFLPDFVFWLKKGNRYAIVFVDPKGIAHTGYQYKVDGFKEIYEESGKPREFPYKGLAVTVHLLLYTEDRGQAPQGYREYWADSPEAIPKVLLKEEQARAVS
ncbi:DEAD/DEAH box helicase family protein [Thermus filiformis]|nr:DEAD/DEAH box helicase family protein [Thermus filiformis]